MKKYISIFIFLSLLTGLFTACQSENVHSDKIQVAVSIVPQETFVKEVAGDLIEVVTIIPPGASPANYQPTPKQMTELSESSVYFSIGVPTEDANIMPNMVELNKEIKVVELDRIVGDVYPVRYFEEQHEHDEEEGDEHDGEEGHEHEGRDPHIWMSPKRVIVMIEAIRDELAALDPENEVIYSENAEKYIRELEAADEEIHETMEKLTNKAFIIMHPSMGYFADDYGLEMIALEEEGKEATAAHLQNVIEYAKKENIKVVFYQAEFDNQQAETLASEIKGETLELEPLAADYIGNLTRINETFKSVLE